jgi:spoIIIJ-associated protein
MVSGKYTVQDTGPRIDIFLKKIVAGSGFELTYSIESGSSAFEDFETPDILVKFTGPDVDMLLENKAELLLALEQLTTEALGMSPEEHSMVCFDANDHRLMRIEELRLSAVTAAEKVRKTRAPFLFSPMNSRERRILHLALRNETGIRSESVGQAPHRQVAIVPEDMKELPAPTPIQPSRPMRTGGPPSRGGGPPRFGRGDRRDRGGDRPGGDRRGGDPRGGRGRRP